MRHGNQSPARSAAISGAPDKKSNIRWKDTRKNGRSLGRFVNPGQTGFFVVCGLLYCNPVHFQKRCMFKLKTMMIACGLLFLGASCVPATEPQPPQPQPDDLIRVSNPAVGQLVTSPLTVTGEARGNWYFEASFPLRLEDENGTVLATGYAQAQGEWMTTDFVPFSGTLNFPAPATPTGVLILEKDNPSGLPEHADERRIPVQLQPVAEL